MFIVFPRFSANRGQAGELMQAHREWIRRGLDAGVFLLAGNIQPQAGGAILAHGVALPELRDRVDSDPFVAADVVRADIIEVVPGQTDPRLNFLQA